MACRLAPVVFVLAFTDWAIALCLLLTRTDTPVAAPLLVLAATAMVTLQAPRVRGVVRSAGRRPGGPSAPDHRRGLVLRIGFWTEIVVPRDAVARARRVTQSGARGLTFTEECATLGPGGTTNLVLTLSRPVPVGSQSVTEIRLWADDPNALAGLLRR